MFLSIAKFNESRGGEDAVAYFCALLFNDEDIRES
jgi:hypothetical protein